MKEVRRQTISVKDKPLFSAVRNACVVNTVTTFKIKKKKERERKRENEMSVTTIGKGSLQASSAPSLEQVEPVRRGGVLTERAGQEKVDDSWRSDFSLGEDEESWNFTLNDNNKYVEHKRRRCFLQEH